MEDTLREVDIFTIAGSTNVLILVLMEDTLRDGRVAVFNDREDCLNPCFNGRYSQSKIHLYG